MNTKLVTIVVPVYNVEKYLDNCIKSLVKQTYINLEIVLVDDGSIDNSPAICNEWAQKDSRIVVIHKKNEGAGTSRNKGIAVSHGDYILFVDSDDYIKENLVEKCINVIDGDKAAIVMFGIENVDEMGNYLDVNIPYSDKYVFLGDEVTQDFLPEMIFSIDKHKRNLEIPACMANFYSMDILKRIGWKFESEKEYFSEDLYSLLKLYPYINKVVVINEALYSYRHISGSLSTSSRITNYSLIRKFYSQCLEICEINDYSDKVRYRVSEPYLSFSIACLKATMCLVKDGISKRKKIMQILKDDRLYQAISNRNLRIEKKSKRILYSTILRRQYGLAYLLIYLQTVRKR